MALTSEIIAGAGKIYTQRPSKGNARNAWDALTAKSSLKKLERMYYWKSRRVWVGIYKFTGTGITYWPRIPMARISD